jgi:hypothetical protein
VSATPTGLPLGMFTPAIRANATLLSRTLSPPAPDRKAATS